LIWEMRVVNTLDPSHFNRRRPCRYSLYYSLLFLLDI